MKVLEVNDVWTNIDKFHIWLGRSREGDLQINLDWDKINSGPSVSHNLTSILIERGKRLSPPVITSQDKTCVCTAKWQRPEICKSGA